MPPRAMESKGTPILALLVERRDRRRPVQPPPPPPAERAPAQARSALRERARSLLFRARDVVVEGYDARSIYALVCLSVLYGLVGMVFSNLFIFQWAAPSLPALESNDWRAVLGEAWRHVDLLLPCIWIFMSALLCWRIVPERDLTRAFVGFVGGLLIEAWGTVTVLWHYYTQERPPIWILPAWPVAALAIDRIAWFLDKALPPLSPRATQALWWCSLPPFVAWFTAFVSPTGHDWATQLAFFGMLLVLGLPKDHREDLCIFWGGAALGWFLEYWGTSRHCWTYYTEQIPPLQAVFAHGFASVAFARGAWGLGVLRTRVASVITPERATDAGARRASHRPRRSILTVPRPRTPPAGEDAACHGSCAERRAGGQRESPTTQFQMDSGAIFAERTRWPPA